MAARISELGLPNIRSAIPARSSMRLFDSEKFHPSSERTLFVGSEELEAEREAEQGPADQRQTSGVSADERARADLASLIAAPRRLGG